jgi:hypothetical protein
MIRQNKEYQPQDEERLNEFLAGVTVKQIFASSEAEMGSWFWSALVFYEPHASEEEAEKLKHLISEIPV